MSDALEIAVVISTRNRSQRLKRALDALAQQVADDFEVIVVDNGSADSTGEVLSRELEAGRLRLRAITNPRDLGAAASRNVGWRATDAPLVAFTDDDCEPLPNWIESLLAEHREHPDDPLQGVTFPNPRERDALGPFSRTIDVSELGPFFQTCNIAYPRGLLERLAGFDDETYRALGGEDTDLAWRAMELGAEPRLVSDAVVHHAVHKLGPSGTLRLALRWSDAMAVIGRHPGLRRYCHRWLFWKRSHMLFLVASLGLSLARKFPPAILLVVPYIRQLRARGAAADPSLGPFLAAYDLLEIAGTARGAVRHRTPII